MHRIDAVKQGSEPCIDRVNQARIDPTQGRSDALMDATNASKQGSKEAGSQNIHAKDAPKHTVTDVVTQGIKEQNVPR